MSDNDERRRAERFPYRTIATLKHGDVTHEAHLLNISKTGVLIAVLDDHILKSGDQLSLFFDEEDVILNASVAHVKAHYLGLACDPMSEQDKENLLALIEKSL